MKTIHLELLLTLEWERIDTVRQAVALCLQAAFDNADLESSLAMVSAELLENAVKYGKSSAQIRLTVEELPDGVQVVVRNPVEEASPHSDVLKQRVAWLGNFSDAQSAYTAALERAYDNPGAGGLGLARIAHEGGCSVRCETSPSGEVTVSAWRQRADRAVA
ncbi:MAG TPA: ATP-binding protein [Polyangiaceae bacterium]|nr:ATP-binding protein [Polyangiaceae bacterium]